MHHLRVEFLPLPQQVILFHDLIQLPLGPQKAVGRELSLQRILALSERRKDSPHQIDVIDQDVSPQISNGPLEGEEDVKLILGNLPFRETPRYGRCVESLWEARDGNQAAPALSNARV